MRMLMMIMVVVMVMNDDDGDDDDDEAEALKAHEHDLPWSLTCQWIYRWNAAINEWDDSKQQDGARELLQKMLH